MLKRFRSKRVIHVYEPEPIVKVKPPTAQNSPAEESNPYLVKTDDLNIYAQQAQTVMEKIPGVEAILLEYLEKESSKTGLDENSVTDENLEGQEDILDNSKPPFLDLDYSEYLNGTRLTDNIIGVWVIDELRAFQTVSSEPSFISFRDEYYINKFSGPIINDVSNVSDRFAENIEIVEETVAEHGGINSIVLVRFA